MYRTLHDDTNTSEVKLFVPMEEKKKVNKKIGKGISTRITIDIPNDLYYAIKQQILDKRIKSIKAYFLSLAENDLNNSNDK